MPTSVRLTESDEERYRQLAELQKIPLAEWIRRALHVRAETLEKWIAEDRFIDAGEKGYIFIDELPPKQAEKLTKGKKS